MLCLVSGGADSTCLYHALRELGYRVSALHVDHGLRGAESDEDAAWCAEQFDAEVVQARRALRDRSRAARRPLLVPAGELRATGHTLSDQVETILYRLASRGTTRRDRGAPRGWSRPPAALRVARGDGGVLPRARARVAHRLVEPGDAARADPQRDPAAARAHPSRGARERPSRRSTSGRRCRRRSPSCSTSPVGSKRVDLGGGVQAVREHDRLWLESGPRELDGRSSGAGGASNRSCPGLKYEGGGRVTGSPAARRRCRTCSSTPRSRAPTVTAGRSSCVVTRSWRYPESSRRRG